MSGVPYGLIIEAFTESAMATWIGLLFYEVASLAPSSGHYTVSLFPEVSSSVRGC